MAHTAKTKKIMSLLDTRTAPPVSANPAIKPPDVQAVPQVFFKTEPGIQIINIAFLLINEQLAAVMERFRSCTCDKCTAAVTEIVLKKIPQVFVTVREKSDEDAVNQAAAQYRSQAVQAITKAVISVRTNPPH